MEARKNTSCKMQVPEGAVVPILFFNSTLKKALELFAWNWNKHLSSIKRI